MEVGPTCHYVMGGIRVDPETQESNVPGLFAAGEAAAGLHGANRLGGNSLSDLLVFGRRAGAAAARHACSSPPVTLDAGQIQDAAREMLDPFERAGGESPYDIQRDLQDLMQSRVGIFRNEDDLKTALDELEKLKARVAKVSVQGSRLYNPGWHLSQELRSLMIVSEAVARAALERKESRGAHSRIDFPKYDERWSKLNNVMSKDGDRMKLEQRPLPEMPEELKQLLAEGQ
jgi:succinate dehydrogenase / fumarate reductase, flavoprotein subunit